MDISNTKIGTLSIPTAYVMKHISETVYDSADVDSYIVYMMYLSGCVNDALPYIEKALNGKANRLFELFGMKYDAAIDAKEFLQKITA